MTGPVKLRKLRSCGPTNAAVKEVYGRRQHLRVRTSGQALSPQVRSHERTSPFDAQTRCFDGSWHALLLRWAKHGILSVLLRVDTCFISSFAQATA